MWQRNLVFVMLVGGGAVALAANLMPPREPRPVTRHDSAAYADPEFRTAVDRVDASFRPLWADHNVPPAAPAPALAVARRLALGLMGTVPSLEEIRQFEWLPADERLPWWIDHLLQDPRTADYLAERFARAYVGTEDGPFIFFRRRRFVNWLSEQFAKNRPYDQVVRDLLTARGLWTDKPATNFVSVTLRKDEKNQPDPVRLAGRVTRAFLGLRLDCAECHNHPYAEWKQADFRGLSAFFGQTHLGFSGIYEDDEGEYEALDKKTNKPVVIAPRVPFSQNLLPEEGTRRERLAAWVTHPKNPYFARAAVNRVWALLVGKPLVDPVDNLETEAAIPPALDLLAEDFASHGFDLRRLIRVIASTQVFRMDSSTPRELTEEEEKAWSSYPMTRLRPEQVVGGLIQASSVTTLDSETHIVFRLIRLANQRDFVERYGDSGEDEFGGKGGTIPQRLLLMNGDLIHERIKESPFSASTRIAWLAQTDATAIECAYLAVLTRRPSDEERQHFEQILADGKHDRPHHLEDMYWALLNSTEFSWNH